MTARGRGRPRESSHEEIRDVAIELFLAQGYAKTSLSEVAQAAGISRTTLFSYFPSKRDLLWKDFDRRAERAADALADEETPDSVVDLILRAILLHARYDAAEREQLQRRRRVVDQDEELRAFMSLSVTQLTDHLRDAAAARAPEVDSGLVDLLAHALVAAAAHCTDEWTTSDIDEPLDAYVRRRMAPIADGLRSVTPR
ncbi:TetR family transcriptional regulator [Microbacterium luteum]|uniref:TetR family transcriptional regulator n=1 Tax=Microbacterium TaxID=33882 RepID=UPI001887CB5D|nr:TetR/AcrR family transcriptional regulator [Microbacterium luteum]